MHELSIAVNIVDGVLEEVRQRALPSPAAVHIRLGRLAGVDKTALLYCYPIACQDTALANSSLVIEEVDVLVFCPVCNTQQPTESFPALLCAHCGSLAERVVQGKELEITGLELVT